MIHFISDQHKDKKLKLGTSSELRLTGATGISNFNRLILIFNQ